MNKTGRQQEAEKILRQAIESQEKRGTDRDALAHTHNNLAELLKNAGRSGEAEKAYVQAIAIWAKLATEHPQQREYRQQLAYAHWNVAAVLMTQKRLPEAEEIYRQGLAHWQKLVDNWPDNPWYRHELAYNHGLLGGLLKTTNRPEEAEKVYRRAIVLQQEVVAAAPTNAGYRMRLAECHDWLGEMFENLSRLPQAEEERRRALAIVEKLTSEFPNVPDYRWHLGMRYDHLAEVLKQAKRPAEAVKAYHRLLELAPQSAVGHNNLAWLLATCPDPIFRDASRAVAEAKKAVELAPKEGNHWNTLGVAHYRAGDWKAAIAALGKSMELRKGGDAFDWFILAMARWQLGDKQDARKWYDKAVQWTEKNRPKDEELGRFRREAEVLLRIAEK